MDKENKKIFRNNTIKLVIGLVLLSFSFVYLQNHPAEKASLRGGFKVMFQKMEVLVHKITGNDPEVVQTQHDYEQYLEALIKMAEDQKCFSTDTISELKNTYTEIKKSSLDDFKVNLRSYQGYISDMETVVKRGCEG